MRRLLFASIAIGALAISVPGAQMRVTPIDELHGHVALGLTLRHLANTGIVMEATAHPDDEDNGLLVMLNRGQGFRTTRTSWRAMRRSTPIRSRRGCGRGSRRSSTTPRPSRRTPTRRRQS